MELKLIIYIIGGILYFFYTIGKKAEEKKKNAPQQPKPAQQSVPAPVTRPVSPPTRSPMETVVREMKRQQAEKVVQKKEAADTFRTKQTEKQAAKELFLHEKKKATFGSGAGDAPVYEPTKDEENIFERDNEISNQTAYHLPNVATAVANDEQAFEFDVRQAFIGTIIFERKF